MRDPSVSVISLNSVICNWCVKPEYSLLLSGVGKSCLTHLIAHNEPIHNPSWTVGCSVEVKLHEFREGTQHQKSYFIELWDIGGSSNHRSTRSVFYNSVHGNAMHFLKI